LCEEAHEEFQPDLSKAEASKRIDELQKKSAAVAGIIDGPTERAPHPGQR